MKHTRFLWSATVAVLLWSSGIARAQTVSCSGVAAWSANSVNYAVGALVTYNGSEYACLQANTSQTGWDPVDAPSLWSLQGSCGSTTGGGTTGGGAEGPYGGTPASVPGTVSAADYDTGGQGVGYSVTAVNGSANGYRADGVDLEATADGGGVAYDVGWSGAGQWFRYTVNVSTAGTYTVACRVANGSTSSGSFHISDSSGANLSGAITVASTGGWQTWTTVDAVVTLPAGQQVLTFDQDSGDFNWHWFGFTLKSSGEGPFGGTAASIPGTVSAADYDTGGQGVGYRVTAVNGTANSYRTDGVDLESTSDTGGVAYNLGWSGAGQWFRYTADVATAGTYTVACRVSNGTTSSGSFHIANASGSNLSGAITVAPTGGWQTWTTVNATVTLPAGRQVLTFEQDSGGFNWHWFGFTLNSSGEGPYGGTAASIPGTVQAENYDTGGEGVGYHVTSTNGSANGYRSDGVDLETTTDGGGGYDLGWSSTGQWFNYTVNVATAGTYTATFRVANGTTSSGSLHIQDAAGGNLSGSVSVAPTGGWQTWTNVTANVALPAGQQVLTVYQDTGGYNINYVSFTSGASCTSVPGAPSGLSASGTTSSGTTLSWNGVSAPSNCAVSGYTVYVNGTAVATVSSGTSYTVTGLSASTTYTFSVAAVDAAGTGAPSSSVSVTTLSSGLNPNNPPGSNFNLSGYTLQLPTGSSGNIDMISGSQLAAGYTDSPYFYTDSVDGAMDMMDPHTGWTTSGSLHPRVEFRENAIWPTSGTNILNATVVVAKVPSNTTIAQIFQGNGPSKPLCELQCNSGGGINLLLENTNQGGNASTWPITSVPIGTKFNYRLQLSGTTITVVANGVTKTFTMDPSFDGEEFYFKAGDYDQSAVSGTPSTTVSTLVKFYALTISHN